jgi:LEA14-like dessication related protein
MKWLTPGVVILCFGCMLLGGCSAPLSEPTVTVTNITLEGASLSSLNVLAKIQVDNPNPVGITIANLSFDLYYETDKGEQYLGHGGQENLIIPKSSTTTFDIPVEIGTSQGVQAIGVVLQKGSVPVILRGTAAVDLKVTTVKIPFEKRQVVPQR